MKNILVNPLFVTEALKTKIDEKVHEDRRFTLNSLHISFRVKFQDGFFLRLLHTILTTKTVCQISVLNPVWGIQEKRMENVLIFLIQYGKEWDKLLDCIVTGDKICVSHKTPETKWIIPKTPMKWIIPDLHQNRKNSKKHSGHI